VSKSGTTNIFDYDNSTRGSSPLKVSPLKNAPISQSPVPKEDLDSHLSEFERKIRDTNMRWLGIKPKG